MKNKRISLLSVFLLLVLLLGAALFFASQYMLRYSLQPTCEPFDRDGTLAKKAKEYPWQKDWIDSLRECRGIHDLKIISRQNGVTLHAVYMPAVVPNSKTALLVHGYGCNSLDMIPIAYIYHHILGMNVLMPDLYGHGDSMGNHVNMGWLDRKDALQWATVADSLYGGNTQIVMHGVSMGGATVMMASGEQVPSCIRAFVDDCGYTSVWDEFAGELRARFSLPSFPLMYTTSWLCRQRYGWDFHEASSLRQVAHCRLPMLFIHGDEDTFVPTRMVYELYHSKPQPKRIWISKGSKHAKSYSDYPEEYTRQVTSFVNDYLPNRCLNIMDNVNGISVHELACAIRERMVRRNLTMSVAESCTGGRIAALLTSVSGASEYFQGGLVAYQNNLKEGFLGVSESVIREYDVVSQPVVEQMVRGACAMFHTDCAIASTGYAGNGNERIPAGTIWLAWGTMAEVHSLCLRHDDGREENTARATRVALSRFLSWLDEME